MKSRESAIQFKKLRLALRKNKRLAIITSSVALILITGVSFTTYNHFKNVATKQPAIHNSSQKMDTTQPTTSPIAVAEKEAEKPSESPQQSKPTATASPAPKKTQSAVPYNPNPPGPNRFTSSNIQSAFTSCNNGVLWYTIAGLSIYSRDKTTEPFTWRLEVSDGTVSDSGTDTMPNGGNTWFNFPSTPDYPTMLGHIEGADDGDKVRFVITSPSYYASAWTTPVPVGSKEACRNGQM